MLQEGEEAVQSAFSSALLSYVYFDPKPCADCERLFRLENEFVEARKSHERLADLTLELSTRALQGTKSMREKACWTMLRRGAAAQHHVWTWAKCDFGRHTFLWKMVADCTTRCHRAYGAKWAALGVATCVEAPARGLSLQWMLVPRVFMHVLYSRSSQDESDAAR